MTGRRPRCPGDLEGERSRDDAGAAPVMQPGFAARALAVHVLQLFGLPKLTYELLLRKTTEKVVPAFPITGCTCADQSKEAIKMTHPTETKVAVKDHVCGMNIDADSAAGRTEYKGQTYYFCGQKCKEKFDLHPDQYLGKGAPKGGCGCCG